MQGRTEEEANRSLSARRGNRMVISVFRHSDSFILPIYQVLSVECGSKASYYFGFMARNLTVRSHRSRQPRLQPQQAAGFGLAHQAL